MQKKHLSVLIICLALGALFAIVQVGISNGMISGYWVTNLFLMGINIILAASLNLINGFTGEFSLGHAGFMAVGAYAGVLSQRTSGCPFLCHRCRYVGTAVAKGACRPPYIKVERLPGYCNFGFWRDRRWY